MIVSGAYPHISTSAPITRGTRTRRGDRWAWEKLPGHNRNEALDCRDYANAGLKIINPDMDAIERRLQGLEEKPKAPQQRRQRPRHNRADAFDDW